MSCGAPSRFASAALLLLAAGLAAPALSGGVNEKAPWVALTRHRPLEALAELPAEALRSRSDTLAATAARLALAAGDDSALRAGSLDLAALATGDDEVAAAASYLTGRIEQLHRAAPDCARAASLFEATAQRFPRSYWGQLALVKLAVLQLYVLPAQPAEDRVAAVRAALPRVTQPELRRDLHLLVGRAAVDFGQPLADALADLIAAEAAGGLSQAVRAELQLQIGVLSHRAGRPGPAADYLRRFIAGSPVDPRVFMARQELAQIVGGEAPTTP